MNYAEDEKTIDLKQMLYYVLKHWKQIFTFLMIGVLLGSTFSLVRGQKTLEDLDLDDEKLNIEKVDLYHQTVQMYEMQTKNEKDSVWLQMDPNNVYTTSRIYHLTIPVNDVNLISERYSAILSDTSILDELIEASGLNCDQQTIRELVGLSFSTYSSSTIWTQYGLTPVHARVKLSAVAPSETIGEALLAIIDAHVKTLQNVLATENARFSYEMLSENHLFGYNDSVRSSQEASIATLRAYNNEIKALEEEMTDDEKFYYMWTYKPDEIEFSLLTQTVIYAILGGALFCMLACFCYAVLFIFDDRLLVADTLSDYGLYTIACLQTGKAKKPDFVDRWFSADRPSSNSKEYLLNALKVLCTDKTVLCVDRQDAQTAEIMNWVSSQMDNLCVTGKLADDANALITVKESEGAILFVRLWKTTAFDLKRELQMMQKIDKPVKGVVVLRG